MKHYWLLALVALGALNAHSSLDYVRTLIDQADYTAAQKAVRTIIADDAHDEHATAHMLHGTACIAQDEMHDAITAFNEAARMGNPMGTYYAVIIGLMASGEGGSFDKTQATERLKKARVELESIESAEWKCAMIDELIASIKHDGNDERAQTSVEDSIRCSWCKSLIKAKDKDPGAYHEYEIWKPWFAHMERGRCVTALSLYAEYLLADYGLLAWLVSGSRGTDKQLAGIQYRNMIDLNKTGRRLSYYGIAYGVTLQGVCAYEYLRKTYPLDDESAPFKPEGYDKALALFDRAIDMALSQGENEPYAKFWRQKLIYEYGGQIGFSRDVLKELVGQGIVEAEFFFNSATLFKLSSRAPGGSDSLCDGAAKRTANERIFHETHSTNKRSCTERFDGKRAEARSTKTGTIGTH